VTTRAGTAVLVAALVLSSGIVAGCSGGNDEAEPTADPAPVTPTSAAPSSSVPATRVRLLDPGAAPRREVRYRWQEGSEVRATFTSDLEIEQETAGVRQRFDAPPIRQTVRHEVVAVDGEVATVSAQVEQIEVIPAGTGLTEGEVRELQRQLDPLVGTATTVGMGPRGELVTLEVQLPGGTERGQQVQASDLSGQLLGSTTVLPEAAIGVGARWQVVQEVEHGGLPATVTRTYTATELDDTSLTWSLEVTMASGAGGEVTTGQAPEDELRLRSMTFAGDATGIVRWDDPLGTVEASIRGEQILGRRSGDDGGVRQQVVLAYRGELVDPDAS
jgi:hypothetical protein